MSGRMEQIGGSTDFGSPKQSQTAEFWGSRLAGVEGLEPPTPGFGDRCSSQLSYTPSERAYSGRFSRRHLRLCGNSLADTADHAVWLRSLFCIARASSIRTFPPVAAFLTQRRSTQGDNHDGRASRP